MIDPKFFDDLAKKFADAIPSSVKDMQKDMQKNFRAILQGTFSKLDLVTKEDFETQAGVLNRTRLKLEALEKRLAEIEKKLPEVSKPKTTKSGK